MNLDRLDGGGRNRDSEIFTWLGRIWRHLYRLYPNRISLKACLPVITCFFEPGMCILTTILVGPLVGKLNGRVIENLLFLADTCERYTCEDCKQGQREEADHV